MGLLELGNVGVRAWKKAKKEWKETQNPRLEKVVSSDAIIEKTFSVDMNNLSSGIYMVNVTFNEGTTTKKIIVH